MLESSNEGDITIIPSKIGGNMIRVKDHRGHARWFLYTSLMIATSATALATSLAMGTPAATAASPTIVSLTFDDGTVSQYTLAWQRAIAPHGMNVTYFVPSGKIGSGPGYMTWDQLSTLFAAENEIGGHTVDHVNITGSTLTYDQKVHEVCDDRQALLQHGLDGVSFAYPEGAYDQTAEGIVRNCGYSSARAAGGVSASGPVYAETIPPLDVYATRTWTAPTPSTSPIQLSDMQAVVNAAASHGGGWVQIVIHRVCSQTYDPANYSDCLNSWRPMELDTLDSFLDWMAAAGQTGGAPAGSVVQTVRQTIGPPRTSAPTTQISCNSATCSTSWYRTTVQVTLTATPGPDGSPVAATYYTTDGSTPTTSSQLYTGPFQVAATSTVKFFSVDQAGHAESVKSQLISIDGAAPTVALTSPADGSSFRHGTKITVSATAADVGTSPGSPSGVASVAFYLDGARKLATITTSPYQFRWNTRSVSKGTHTLTAVATDNAGNSATSAAVTISFT
jgi:peptidoglycan/xylan/chitin deacetylase (PgdA/CDA1 family)